ncbi:sensor histidine kinase [Mangrovibrevibacter kandeliae]|uniref:sensor histidine kinase n=1 Tax=Mangrovibrevibacter kandeliae TaxID=2968473 RepID=UPI0021194F9B|nr:MULTISPECIES: HWE histidine kinase domain-containing protein [unclassified Aurantimonas]MCQ8780856.1 hypothetical protein [Aurantimonas sp. CSK15Z-1]MCW4113636.1 hypothetical protein [Aurantimonas sp. MSK8Z-1]
MAMTSDAPASLPLRRRRLQIRLGRLLRRPPLLVYLAGFALVVLLPALMFSAVLILQFSRQQQLIAAAQVDDTAEIVSNAIDRETFAMITAGRVLATSPLLDQDDLETFHERTLAALSSSNTFAALVDPNLNVVVNTRSAFPSPLVPLSHTEQAEKVFATGQSQISGVFYGNKARELVFHVAIPVFRQGRVVYVLVINKTTDSLGSVITDQNLPSAWSAVVTDATGKRIFAALASNGKYQKQPQDAASQTTADQLLGNASSGRLLEANYVSPLTGWTTTVAVPRAVVGQAVQRSWQLLATGGILLIVFCVALAVYVGKRIATPILRLKDQAEAIAKGEPAPAIKADIDEIGEVSKVLAQASRERLEAEEQNRFLMREMTHRAKNQYALIAAIARRAAKDSADTKEFLDTLSQALNSLARSADLLAGHEWEGAALADLVAMQLNAFGGRRNEQVVMSGPALCISPAAAQTIGLALHELATNAAKYGALSVEGGHVSVEWSLAENFRLVWRETNGPPVTPPKRSGFGTLVTQRMTARGLGGTVDMDYAASGVVWTLTAPLDAVVAEAA